MTEPQYVELFGDLEKLFTEKMKESLKTGHPINMPGWIDDMINWIAQWIVDSPPEEQDRLLKYAHERLDHYFRTKRLQ